MIIKNTIGKRATVLAIANVTYNANSFAIPNNSIEIINGLTIRSVNWTSNGVWTISTGSNTLFTLTNDGVWDLAGWGMSIDLNVAANLNITLSSGSTGTLIMDVGKISRITGNYGYYNNA